MAQVHTFGLVQSWRFIFTAGFTEAVVSFHPFLSHSYPQDAKAEAATGRNLFICVCQ